MPGYMSNLTRCLSSVCTVNSNDDVILGRAIDYRDYA